jgi:hypothetical protein
MVLVLPIIVGFSNGLGWVHLRIWVRLLKIYDDIRGINWRWWQSLDSASIKAPLGETRQVVIPRIEEAS